MSNVERPGSRESVRVRLGTRVDIAAIVDLVQGAYRGEGSRLGWTTEADLLDGQRTDSEEVEGVLADPEARVILAESSSGLLGCVVARREADGIHIGMFAVRPALQGQGIGRRLLEEAERVGRLELGGQVAILYVISVRNELLAWYARRGYQDTGQKKPFPYGSARFGSPRRSGLEFSVLCKALTP